MFLVANFILLRQFCTMEIEDFYEHPDSNIEYILENIPNIEENDCPNYKNYVESQLASHCFCTNNCLTCSNYKSALLCKDAEALHECNDYCSCEPNKCCNRIVQKGPSKSLVIKESSFVRNQFGCFATNFLPKGTFICEYAGEIVSAKVAKEREGNYCTGKNYILCLNLKPLEGDSKRNSGGDQSPYQTFIDPTKKGNIGRYLNHSCEPNCDSIVVRVNSLVPKIAFFTNKDVNPSEELTFSYGEVDLTVTNKSICMCGFERCRKYLPNLNF